LRQPQLDYSKGDKLTGKPSEIPKTFWILAHYVETYFISECRDTQHYGLDDRGTLVYRALNLTENLGPN
jgi:hypothetical protein